MSDYRRGPDRTADSQLPAELVSHCSTGPAVSLRKRDGAMPQRLGFTGETDPAAQLKVQRLGGFRSLKNNMFDIPIVSLP